MTKSNIRDRSPARAVCWPFGALLAGCLALGVGSSPAQTVGVGAGWAVVDAQ
jgi:hypothetical protein